MRLLLVFLLLHFSSQISAQGILDGIRIVNSVHDEQNPLLSPDGQTLYFTLATIPGTFSEKRSRRYLVFPESRKRLVSPRARRFGPE